MSKRAVITGITGQDGSYLAELLLENDTSSASSVEPVPRISGGSSTSWIGSR